MKRFKVLSFMSVFLLLFAGVALAQNAESVFVEVGYPCPGDQDECDTDAAVSRQADGDIVNLLITLLDASGNPATAGPTGELLSSLTVTVSTTLGDTIEANAFAADAAGVALGNDATARANIDYTNAIPGTDQVVVTVSSEPEALVGQASVNVIAPPATSLVVRTLRTSAPPQNLYEQIPDPADNLGGWEPAGSQVEVTVIAAIGDIFTPDPSLDGKTVIVQAYADYSEDGIAGGGVPGADIAGGFEENPLGDPVELTISGGQVTGTVQIDNAGPADPEGLNVVFTAEIDEEGGISSTLMNGAGVDLNVGAINDFSVDTVEMRAGSPAGLLVAMDPYGNGNLVLEEDCLLVFDDDAGAGGTAVPFEVILVDALNNATLASGNIDIALALGGGELETQLIGLSNCGDDLIDDGNYHQGCSLQDSVNGAAGQVITQNITLSSPQVTQDQVPTSLVPGADPDIDLTVEVAPAGALNAGDEVVLTLSNAGGYFPFSAGETLEISATGPAGPQWISLSDFAAADTTLNIPANDADTETEGLQLPPIAIFGPCTDTVVEAVTVTVKIPGRCDDVGTDSNPITDIEPSDPATLALVSLEAGTDSELDVPRYVGTDPVVGNTPLLADGVTSNAVLICDDVEVRDEFDNVLDGAPNLTCSVPLGIVDDGDCNVNIVWVSDAADTTQTVNCTATDYTEVDGRNISIPLVAEIGEGPSGDATALVARQEAPQDQDGTQLLPCGEAIIQIFANGTLAADLAIQVSFGEGTVEGAEIRGLASEDALAEPLPETLPDTGEVLRLVIYAPTAGPVNLVVTDASGVEEPLTQADLALSFCQPVECEAVTVTCEPASIDCEECTVCTAITSGDGCNEPSYTWDSSGGTVATGNTGNSITVCEDTPEAQSTITVTATDTANENLTGSTTVEDTCGDPGPGDCVIDVLRDSLPKSNLFVLYPLALRIETLGIEGLNGFTPVTIDCDADGATLLSKSVLKTGKWVQPNFGTNTTVIWQSVLIWPAWWTQSVGLGSETCTVTVGDCPATDTFELTYGLFGIPNLSQ